MNFLAVSYRIGPGLYFIIALAVLIVLGLVIKQKIIRSILFVMAGAIALLLIGKAFNIIPDSVWQEIKVFFWRIRNGV